MTYREAIQSQVQKLEELYDNAGSLRDAATGSEKEHWNNLRGQLRSASSNLQSLDNRLSNDRAAMPLNGEY